MTKLTDEQAMEILRDRHLNALRIKERNMVRADIIESELVLTIKGAHGGEMKVEVVGPDELIIRFPLLSRALVEAARAALTKKGK